MEFQKEITPETADDEYDGTPVRIEHKAEEPQYFCMKPKAQVKTQEKDNESSSSSEIHQALVPIMIAKRGVGDDSC